MARVVIEGHRHDVAVDQNSDDPLFVEHLILSYSQHTIKIATDGDGILSLLARVVNEGNAQAAERCE